jgi:chemotaxis methyl-accepting protein methylase
MSKSPARIKPLTSAQVIPVAVRPPGRPGEFISWVLQRAGLDIESYRSEPLERRLSACLRVLHACTEEQARRMIVQCPELLPVAISSLLIGVTSFFRDNPVFETLQTKVLPELARRRRPLRVWSVGCSTGAELYSLAILLAQAGLIEGSFLLGTDCRPDAIEHARAALYGLDDLQWVEPAARSKFFEAAECRWRPIELLRWHVQWKIADLCRGSEDGPWDMILWRNMAIYLKTQARASAWKSLASVLSPEGVMVVGRAERPPVGVLMAHVGPCLYSADAGSGGGSGRPPLRLASYDGKRNSETFV